MAGGVQTQEELVAQQQTHRESTLQGLRNSFTARLLIGGGQRADAEGAGGAAAEGAG